MIEYLVELIKNALASNEFFAGGALLGVLAWIGMQLRTVPQSIWFRIRRFIRYSAYMDSTNEMYGAFADWLLEKYPSTYRNVETLMYREHKDRKVNFITYFRQHNDFNILWYRKRMLFITKNKVTLENASTTHMRHLETYSVAGLFARDAIKHMMDDVREFHESRHATNVGIRSIIMGSDGQEVTKYIDTYKRMDDIFLANKQELLDDLDNFMAKQPKYQELGIKFKRGYLFYGPPGTGKTTLVFAVADKYDMPIHYINPSGFMNDTTFEDFVAGVDPWSIILIEDVDIFWTSRDKKQQEVGVSFQSLLNVLDGLHSPNNVLIFMTTNKHELFDEAFLRKGRLDFKMMVDHPGKAEVEAFLARYYDREQVELANYKGGKPMVDIQDLCIKNDYLTVLNILENEWNQNAVRQTQRRRHSVSAS